MTGKIPHQRGFSALHVCEPIAGLRSSGKGANRTILDCCSARLVRKSGLSAAAGAAGAGSLFRVRFRVSGAVPLAADEKGLGIVTTASSADHPTRRNFLFVGTGAVAALGAAAAVVPFVLQMNPDAATIAAGAPIEGDLGPIPEGQEL